MRIHVRINNVAEAAADIAVHPCQTKIEPLVLSLLALAYKLVGNPSVLGPRPLVRGFGKDTTALAARSTQPLSAKGCCVKLERASAARWRASFAHLPIP